MDDRELRVDGDQCRATDGHTRLATGYLHHQGGRAQAGGQLAHQDRLESQKHIVSQVAICT